MTKSEKIGALFGEAMNHMELAECAVQKIKEIPSRDAERINAKFIELFSLIEDANYEICMPLEMEEEERAEEIRVLERRLAELRAQ